MSVKSVLSRHKEILRIRMYSMENNTHNLATLSILY